MECLSPILGKRTKVRPIGYGVDSWQLVQCEESGFVFLLDPPCYDEVAVDFAWEKTFQDERKKRQQAEPILHRFSAAVKHYRTRLFAGRDKMFALTRRHVGNKRRLDVLDIGPGQGHRMVSFCNKFLEHGIDVTPCGIELSPELAKMSHAKLADLGGSVLKDNALHGMTRFPTESFDVVVMSCYLEHEAQPLEVLRRTSTVLKPDGVVIVKVPNYNSVNRLCRGSRWCGFRFPDHVNYFTPATLRIVAQQSGFEMAEQRFTDRLPTSDNMYAVFKKATEGRAQVAA